MKLNVVIATALLSAANPAMGQWLCVTDLTTGFSFDGKKWVSTDFAVSSETFVLRALKQPEIEAKASLDKLTKSQTKKISHGKYMLGKDSPTKYCYDHGGYISCASHFGEFKFSKSALRFIETHSNGYWYGEDNNDNTPGISIGSCTTI